MRRRLEVRLLHYFLLITLAAVMIGIEFYFELGGVGQATLAAGEQVGGVSLESLRTKIVIMFGVLCLVVAIVLMMFIRNITNPLQKMANAAEKINQGDLSQVIAVESNDEIGQVGTTINGLTSNLQEVAVFGSVTCREALARLETVAAAVERGEVPDPREIAEIRAGIATLQEFVDSFKFL